MIGIIVAVLAFIVLAALVIWWMRANCVKKRQIRTDGVEDKVQLRKVRIAYISQNAILLCPRDEESARCGDNLDLPLQTVLKQGETVEHGLARLLCPLYPESLPDVRFCLKHCCGEYDEVYLFLVWCDNAEIPQPICLNYKLWTRRQIEQNLGKGVFAREFEVEYPHFRLMLDVWTMAKS